MLNLQIDLMFMDSLILVADFRIFVWFSLLFFPLIFRKIHGVALNCKLRTLNHFVDDLISCERHRPWSRFVSIFSVVSIHHIFFYSSLIFFSVSVALMRAFCLYPSISPLCFMSSKRRRRCFFLFFFCIIFLFII